MAVAREFRFVGTKPHGSAQIAARSPGLDALFAHPFSDDANHRLSGCAEFG